MTITINVPAKAEILKRSIPVKVAADGELWSEKQLGEYAKKPGVYVHSFNKEILYVGLASGQEGSKYGIFGARLRREFTYKGEKKKDLYNLLASKKGLIDVCMFDYAEIDSLVTSDKPELSPKAKAFIFEQALTAAFDPPGNMLQK